MTCRRTPSSQGQLVLGDRSVALSLETPTTRGSSALSPAQRTRGFCRHSVRSRPLLKDGDQSMRSPETAFQSERVLPQNNRHAFSGENYGTERFISLQWVTQPLCDGI